MRAVFIIISVIILALSLRGLPGNPKAGELNTGHWIEFGPFELSPERGRFALLYSLIEDRSFQFSRDIFNFASPDVGILNGQYVSLFNSGISLIAVPGYLLGRVFGLSQIGSFAIVSVFAIINALLVISIAKKIGAGEIAAYLSGLMFLFATPAFSYAVSLYQHHISTFLILLSFRGTFSSKIILAQFIFWVSFGLAVFIDYPNAILMAPLVFYYLGKIIQGLWIKNRLVLKLDVVHLLTAIIALILPLTLFLAVNQFSYGNPFQLAGTLQSVKNLGSQNQDKTVLTFFNTRDLLNGFYIHLVSPDRGIISYTPVILFGIAGLFIAFKNKVKLTSLLFAIITLNVVFYSLWGDPWGGWAFGSRYLIPAYALMSIFVALFLTQVNRNLPAWVFFLMVMTYSVAVNSAGALTTSAIPPQVEILALEQITKTEQKYTWQKNFDYLDRGLSKAFLFSSYFNQILTARQYHFVVITLIIAPTLFLAALNFVKKGENNYV